MITDIKARNTINLILEGARQGKRYVDIVWEPVTILGATHESKTATWDIAEDERLIVECLKKQKGLISITWRK